MKKISKLIAVVFLISGCLLTGCNDKKETISSSKEGISNENQNNEKEIQKSKHNYEIKTKLYNFSEGIGCIKLVKKEKDFNKKEYGFVDSNFNWIIKPQEFEEVGEFREGLCPVKDKDLWGYINTKGEWVIKPQFYIAGNFSEGVAIVNGDTVEDEFTKISERQTFVIDKKGNKRFKVDGSNAFMYQNDVLFKDGYFFYEDKNKAFDLKGNIHNTENKIKNTIKYSEPVKTSFEGKYVLMDTQNGICLVDIDGNIVKKFGENTTHSRGIENKKFTLGTLDGYRYFDVKGNMILDSGKLANNKKIDSHLEFKEGLAAFRDLSNGKKLKGFINEKGDVVIKPKYHSVDGFWNGYAFATEVRDNGKEGYVVVIDKQGNEVIDSSKMIVSYTVPSTGRPKNMFLVEVRKDKNESILKNEKYILNTKTKKMIKVSDLLSKLES